jgi:ribosomal 50S subunit-associated protein YjgA (DUF615 family)
MHRIEHQRAQLIDGGEAELSDVLCPLSAGPIGNARNI